jgi:hypothetical protein
LKEDPEAVDPEETKLLSELHETLRPQWTNKTESLKGEKEKIQHLQLLIKKNQEQLIKDFDSWYGVRQQQISSALNSTPVKPATNNNTSVFSSSSNNAATGSGRSNKPNPPTTGNAQVDAELARMYEAREALKQRLSANLP